MKPVCRYFQAVHTLLFVPNSFTVIVTNHREDTLQELLKLLCNHKGIEFKREFNTIKYGPNRLRVATIDNIREAYRFAGSEINLLCVDAFMPYFVEEYMRTRVRDLKLPNGDVFKGTIVDLD